MSDSKEQGIKGRSEEFRANVDHKVNNRPNPIFEKQLRIIFEVVYFTCVEVRDSFGAHKVN